MQITIHDLTFGTVLNADLGNARRFQMSIYRANKDGCVRADATYYPHRIDALGLYRFTGALTYLGENLIEGFYTVDDFGQLVRIPFGDVLARLP